MKTKTTRTIIWLLMLLVSGYSRSQTIDVPQGVTYKYANDKVNAKAEKLMTQELQGDCRYKLFSGMLIIGPSMWKDLEKVDSIKNIEKGKVYNRMPVYSGDGKTVVRIDTAEGKLIQTQDDFRLLWNHLRAISKDQKLTYRKLTPNELKYYWSIISFDIEEPVFIVEGGRYKMLVNFIAKDMTILWLDTVS